MTAEERADDHTGTIEFLRLFRPDEWLLHAIPRLGEGVRSGCFPAGPTQDRDAMAWAQAHNDAGCEIYFAINPTRPGLVNKASKTDVTEARWLWVDCDPAKGADEAALAVWRRDKIAAFAIHETIPAPTVTADSGRGLWAFWRLVATEPVDGRGPATAKVESALAGLVEAFGGDAQAKNIDRIARLPGFINHKTGRRSRILTCNPQRVFALEQFPRAAATHPTQQAFTGEQPYSRYIDDAEAVAAVRNYLAGAPPAIADGRGGGRSASVHVMQRCVDLGCSVSRAAELMVESPWNDRCDPPWEQDDLEHELRQLPRDKPVASAHPAVLELGLEGKRLATMFFEPVPDPPPPKPGDLRGFKTAAGFTDEFEPIAYTMEGIIRSNSLYTLTARTGSGKTAFNVILALAVVTGRPDIIGREIEPGRVCYVACENADDVRMRLMAAAFRLKVDLKALGDRLLILDQPMKPEVIARELTVLSKHAPFGLVIVDTLAAMFDGTDFNSNAEGVAFMRRLRLITRAEGRPTILVAAHPVKNAGPDAMKAYGAGGITNEVDANLTLTRDADSDEKDCPVTLHWQEKIRGGDFTPIEYRFESVLTPSVTDVKGRVIALPVMRPVDEEGGAGVAGAARAEAVRTVQAASLEARLLLVIRDAPGQSDRTYASMLDVSRTKAVARLRGMSNERLVQHALKGWRVTPKGAKLAEDIEAETGAKAPVEDKIEDLF